MDHTNGTDLSIGDRLSLPNSELSYRIVEFENGSVILAPEVSRPKLQAHIEYGQIDHEPSDE